MRRIGVHTSIAGGIHKSLERAHELGCNTLQIFSHNPRGWSVKDRDIEEVRTFRRLRRAFNLSPVVVHSSYLINLASHNQILREKSVDLVITEMDIADTLGADYVVLHTGSASGDTPGDARQRAIASLSDIASRGKWKAGLLLENTAGERGDITSKIEEIAALIENVSSDLIHGICIDTCHAFSSGYDLTTQEGIDFLSAEINHYVGKEKIRLLHLNDAKGGAGAGLDRHEHIGKGKIGAQGMSCLIHNQNFRSVPIILETPKRSLEDDIRNLNAVKRLLRKKRLNQCHEYVPL